MFNGDDVILMDHNTIPLFAVPIYISNVDISEDELRYIKNLDYERVGADNGFMSSEKYLLEQMPLKKLYKQVVDHIFFHCHENLNVATDLVFELQNSWCMKHSYGDFAELHTHTNSLLSGIVYMQTDEKSGDLYFQKEKMFQNLFPSTLNIPFGDRNVYNSEAWSFTPKANQIFIFPSHIAHSVTKCLSHKERYCIAFNVFPRGQLTSSYKEKIAELKL